MGTKFCTHSPKGYICPLICLPAGGLPWHHQACTWGQPFPRAPSRELQSAAWGLNRKQPSATPLEGLTGIQPNAENGRKASIILLHSICWEAARRLESD